MKVLVRPLVVWIWIGGFVIALGTLLAICRWERLPRKQHRWLGGDSSLQSCSSRRSCGCLPSLTGMPTTSLAVLAKAAAPFTVTLFDGRQVSLNELRG